MSHDHSTSEAGGRAGEGGSSPNAACKPDSKPEAPMAHGPWTGPAPHHDPFHLGPHGAPFAAHPGTAPGYAPAPHGPVPHGPMPYGPQPHAAGPYGPAPHGAPPAGPVGAPGGYPGAPWSGMPWGYGPAAPWGSPGGNPGGSPWWGAWPGGPWPGGPWAGGPGQDGAGGPHGGTGGSSHAPAAGSFNWTAGWLDVRNEAYLKGLLVGALGAAVLSNGDVQKKALQSIAGLWSLLQGGVEELKERFHDVEAEMQAATRPGSGGDDADSGSGS